MKHVDIGKTSFFIVIWDAPNGNGHELVDLTLCGQSVNSHVLSENGHNLVTNGWHD